MARECRRRWLAAWAGLVALGLGSGAQAADAKTDAERAADDRIAELEKKVEVLASELEKSRSESVVPETRELRSLFGLGPAASKVYQAASGLSLGAYGEAYYRKLVGDEQGGADSADLLRLVLYTGYKFSDRIVFNSEIEFEHATTETTVSSGPGAVEVEFANVDFMLNDALNARVGLVLMPVGFLNEIHEPPYFHGVARPEVERRIIPSTWSDIGAGVFGSLFDDQLEYRAYVVNALNAKGFEASGIREGRQHGNEVIAEHGAFVGRVDWHPFEGGLIGASVYHGNSGQNQNIDFTGGTAAVPDAPLTLWDAHAEFRRYGLELRALVTMAHLGDAGRLTTALQTAGVTSDVIAGEMLGAYGEVAYDVLPLVLTDTQMSLSPFFRYEYLDTQRDIPSGFTGDDSQELEIHTVGLSFKPIPQLVLKADYRSRDSKGNTRLADEFNVGLGLAF